MRIVHFFNFKCIRTFALWCSFCFSRATAQIPFRNCFSSIQSCFSLSHPQAESEVLEASCQLGQQRTWKQGGGEVGREGEGVAENSTD